MTCIVGLVHNGTVYIGGDSAGVSDPYDLCIRSDKKVFRKGHFVMGFTSSFRMGQLLRYSLNRTDQKGGDDFRYMATDFIDSVRDCLRLGGFMKTESEIEHGGTFLVGYRKRLYQIDEDFQVMTADDDFLAIGSGGQVALGSLYTSRADKNPRRRVLTALRTAERFNIGVRGPFTILRMK